MAGIHFYRRLGSKFTNIFSKRFIYFRRFPQINTSLVKYLLSTICKWKRTNTYRRNLHYLFKVGTGYLCLRGPFSNKRNCKLFLLFLFLISKTSHPFLTLKNCRNCTKNICLTLILFHYKKKSGIQCNRNFAKKNNLVTVIVYCLKVSHAFHVLQQMQLHTINFIINNY